MTSATSEDIRERIRLARLSSLYDIVIVRQKFARWHRTHDNQPLDFETRPYLREIVNDPEISEDICKCVQCGVTETELLTVLAASAIGWSVMVVLPNLAQRGRYVHNRIDRPVEYVDEYRDLMKTAAGEFDSVSLKTFGRGVMTFVSAETRTSFRETPADLLVIEEYDECDHENLNMAYGRLDASELRQCIRIANPTTPDRGIAKLFKEGTQREWHIKCRACGEEQPLDWFVNVVETIRDKSDGQILDYKLRDQEWKPSCDRDIEVYCRTCHAALDRLERDKEHAFWRDTNPGQRKRSRHFSQMFLPTQRICEMWKAFKDAMDDAQKMQTFYNERLGLGYTCPGSKLTTEILDHCIANYVAPDAAQFAAAGLDVGGRLDLRIDIAVGDKRRLVFAGKLRTFDEVTEVLDRYDVRLVVADARPETHKLQEYQQELQEKAGYRRLWRCDFLTDSIVGFTYDADLGIVRSDRTALLDKDQQTYVKGRAELPRGAADLIDGEFYQEMTVSERVAAKTPSGDTRYVWTKGKDHQRLASAYCLLALEIGGFFLPHMETSGDVMTPPLHEGEFEL